MGQRGAHVVVVRVVDRGRVQGLGFRVWGACTCAMWPSIAPLSPLRRGSLVRARTDMHARARTHTTTCCLFFVPRSEPIAVCIDACMQLIMCACMHVQAGALSFLGTTISAARSRLSAPG